MAKMKNKAVLGAAGLAILGILHTPIASPVHASTNSVYHTETQETKTIRQQVQFAAAQNFYNSYEAELSNTVSAMLPQTNEDISKRLKEDFLYRVEQEIYADDNKYVARKYNNSEKNIQKQYSQAMQGYDTYKDIIMSSTKYLNLFYHFSNQPNNANVKQFDDNDLNQQLKAEFAKEVLSSATESKLEDIKLTYSKELDR